MIAAAVEEKPVLLVIDDERGPRESIRILLKHEYEIHCAETVDEGIRLMGECNPDLIILDIRMPGKSGIEGLREIRRLDATLSVVMLTGFGALETAQQAMRLGANDYLNKPFDTNEMRQVAKKYTERSRLERKRQALAQQLEDVNKRLVMDLASQEQLAAVGRSSSEFAHDLRNPMMIISGYVELLVKQLEQSKDMMGETYNKTADYLDIIAQNVTRCHDLSLSWRSFGKTALSEYASTKVNDLMSDVVKSIEPLAANQEVAIAYDRLLDDAALLGSRPQLIRALHNIIANAIQAVAPGTGQVWIGCAEEGGQVRICVRDNGCGMSPEVMEQMFRPYFTTKGEERGTGLGLVIAQKIIQEHKGVIDVESKEGQGTTVTVTLPLERAPALSAV